MEKIFTIEILLEDDMAAVWLKKDITKKITKKVTEAIKRIEKLENIGIEIRIY